MELQDASAAMTDEDLARKAKGGEGWAFVELAHRCQHVVYRIAYRFAGTAEDADDLCQDCFIRAYRQLGKYDHRRPFKPWLIRVCSNVCLNWAKSHRRERDKEEPLGETEYPNDAESLESTVVKKMERQAVLRALNEVSPDVRLLLVLRFVQGLTLREIAEQTGIKLPTVAFRIAKGIERLRERLRAEVTE